MMYHRFVSHYSESTTANNLLLTVSLMSALLKQKNLVPQGNYERAFKARNDEAPLDSSQPKRRLGGLLASGRSPRLSRYCGNFRLWDIGGVVVVVGRLTLCFRRARGNRGTWSTILLLIWPWSRALLGWCVWVQVLLPSLLGSRLLALFWVLEWTSTTLLAILWRTTFDSGCSLRLVQP